MSAVQTTNAPTKSSGTRPFPWGHEAPPARLARIQERERQLLARLERLAALVDAEKSTLTRRAARLAEARRQVLVHLPQSREPALPDVESALADIERLVRELVAKADLRPEE